MSKNKTIGQFPCFLDVDVYDKLLEFNRTKNESISKTIKKLIVYYEIDQSMNQLKLNLSNV